MTGSKFMLGTAGPGLGAGVLGLVVGLTGLILDRPELAAGAGLLALVAGGATLFLARRLEDQMALHALVERELGPERPLGRTPERADTAPGASPEQPPADLPPTAGGDPTGDALMDQTTGLFSEDFFRVAVESRIAAARRHLRPISVVLLEVVAGLPASPPRAVEAELVSGIIRTTLREADTACRLRSGYFALLLEDTPENGAIWTVERMRRQLAEERQGLTIWAGVACYPAHAFSPEAILAAAEGALVSAREWRQDRIEVAVAAD